MKSKLVLRWSATGIVFILIGIPAIFEMVPPNRWYGFRVAKTVSDERIWYAANRLMGYDILLAGVAILIAVLLTARLLRGNPGLANRICFLIFLLSSAAALAHGYWALDRM